MNLLGVFEETSPLPVLLLLFGFSPQLEVCSLCWITKVDAHHRRGRLARWQQLCQQINNGSVCWHKREVLFHSSDIKLFSLRWDNRAYFIFHHSPISGNSLTLIPDCSFTSSMCRLLVSEVELLVKCICTATMLASGLNGCRLKQYSTDSPSPVMRCSSS